MKPKNVILLILITTLFLASVIFVIGHIRRTTYYTPRYLTQNVVTTTAHGKIKKDATEAKAYHYEFFAFLEAPLAPHVLPDFELPENPGVKIKAQKRREMYLKAQAAAAKKASAQTASAPQASASPAPSAAAESAAPTAVN